MSDLDLPVVDRQNGWIVKDVNVDSYSAGTGWYVHLIPDQEDKMYGRWRQADDLTKWCDSELVRLPDRFVLDDVDEDWVVEFMEGLLLGDGDSMCSSCNSRVDAGSLVTADGSYVATICPDCKGVCQDCGANDWTHHGRDNAHDARETPMKTCNECGNKTASGVSTA